jgi:anthranilate phosphoribosyltransferase
MVVPEDMGLRRGRFEELASSRDVETDAIALLRVILGKDEGPRADIVCLNAVPVLYVMGKVAGLADGVAMARQVIRDGGAAQKLRDWVSWQNHVPEDGLARLDRMIARAA